MKCLATGRKINKKKVQELKFFSTLSLIIILTVAGLNYLQMVSNCSKIAREN